MTEPGESAARPAAEPSRLRRILSVQGEIRPVVVIAILVLTSLLCFVLVCELVVVLLSLAGVEVFKYLLGTPLLSWLAHRIYQ